MVIEEDVNKALERRSEMLKKFGEEYESQLDERMGQLYNQFVSFISASQLPLSQVLIVLEIIIRETVDQAKKRYLGGD